MNANRIHAGMEVNVSTESIPSLVFVCLVMVDTTVLLVSHVIYIHFKQGEYSIYMLLTIVQHEDLHL